MNAVRNFGDGGNADGEVGDRLGLGACAEQVLDRLRFEGEGDAAADAAKGVADEEAFPVELTEFHKRGAPFFGNIIQGKEGRKKGGNKFFYRILKKVWKRA